jgi:hypothetical protein
LSKSKQKILKRLLRDIFEFSDSDWQKIEPLLSTERLWLMGAAWVAALLLLAFGVGWLKKRLTSFHFPNLSLEKAVFGVWGAVLLYRLFWAWALPLQIDEAFNYVFLVSRGFAVSWAFYPGPNNHVFYTLFCTLWPFLPEKATLRLGTLLFASLYSWLLAWFFQKKYGQKAAIFALLLTASGEYFTIYAAMGRGYAAQNLFCFLAILACLGKCDDRKVLLFVLANFFGFFTLPTHIFFYLPISFFLFFKVKTRAFLEIHAVLTILVFLAYLPILIFNYENFLNNEWIQIKSFENFFLYWLDSIGTYYTFENVGFGLSMVLLVLTASQSKKDELIWIYVLTAVFPVWMCILMDKQPFNRIWFYKMELEFAIWAIFLSKKNFLGTAILVLYVGFNLFLLIEKYFFKPNIYQEVQQAVCEMYATKAKTVYSEVDLYQVFLRLEYLKNKQPSPKIDTDFDSLTQYDVLILKKNHKFASGKLLFEGSDVKIVRND